MLGASRERGERHLIVADSLRKSKLEPTRTQADSCCLSIRDLAEGVSRSLGRFHRLAPA